ncbi:MAG: metallophosphoesterase family protein [Jaaginema sp. PMC 1079.18]|nr:metallophosphoesterase family protein [Jaaginema sp. PMC 1080.18]MEC4852848.1 metallophosphoesterase family protein [Jaaginema sp. PMC 1079.18]MEC4865629.1 metallophosphoesterase family protein [Jaaginema sp. PMC 1078.18]
MIFSINRAFLRGWIGIALFFGLTLLVTIVVVLSQRPVELPLISDSRLLSDPFLQLPTASSVRVVWFTEFPGSHHLVRYGSRLEYSTTAATTQLSRTREDQKSRFGSQTEENQVFSQPTRREIWRHEAEVTGLKPGKRLPYQVVSWLEDGTEIESGTFTLTPKPQPGTPLKILLTSDHQLMPMTAANLQKAREIAGPIDAVFIAGDLINIPDRASEWFDDNRGCAFFPCLQGRAHYQLEKEGSITEYKGAEIIQHAPLYATIGNHEVMGYYSSSKGLNEQFSRSVPRAIASINYSQKAPVINPQNDPAIKKAWIQSNSFNTDTYQEILTLPESLPGGEQYYAVTFGDIRLISLYITNVWRSPSVEAEALSRYREPEADLNNPDRWGYGQHIFEAIAKGSKQYRWLEQELQSEAFQQAKYKVVMFHHPPHTLGDNIVPAYTDPVPYVEYTPEGQVKSVRYEYPLHQDYIIRDVQPLLEQAGVQLVYFGHSHLWNRFQSPSGVHFLESSNVGNSYGAYIGEKKRFVPPEFQETYVSAGDPNGLEPITPNIAPLLNPETNEPLPYIASNDITVFSILDTQDGSVTSYRFDTRKPDSEVMAFDRFELR